MREAHLACLPGPFCDGRGRFDARQRPPCGLRAPAKRVATGAGRFREVGSGTGQPKGWLWEAPWPESRAGDLRRRPGRVHARQ